MTGGAIDFEQFAFPAGESSGAVPQGLPHNPGETLRPETRAAFNEALATASGRFQNRLSEWRFEGEEELPGQSMPVDKPSRNDVTPYILKRFVARGGYGEVWEALQISLDRVVAVKRPREDKREGSHESSWWGVHPNDEFRQEAVVTAHLEHPNIVPVHDLGMDARGRPILAMKLVRGETWQDRLLEDRKALSANEFMAKHVPILREVALAVAFAHSRGVVHRDLKPAQVMIGEFGEVLLMDWGLAVGVEPVFRDEADRVMPPPMWAPSRLGAANPAGTPVCMAPEQTHHSAEFIGPWTDIYLLGGILYVILTGTYPHETRTSEEAFLRARIGEVTDPAVRAPGRDMPAELAALAMHSLARNPADRIGTVMDFVKALDAFLSGATRLREARRISEEVRARLEAGKADYLEFSEMDVSLANARALWPGLPGAAELCDNVRAGHARLALEAGDLRLARTQAMRLTEGGERDTILAEVDAAAHRLVMIRRTRVVAVAASLVLCAALAAGGISYVKSQKAAALALTAERDVSNASRAEAERLVEYMVSDLKSSLRSVRRLDLMEGTLAEVLQWTEGRPDPDEASVMEIRAQALNSLSEVRREQGRYDESVAAAQEAVELRKALADRQPSAGLLRVAYAGSLTHLALAHEAKGDWAAAEAAMRETLAIDRETVDISAVSQDRLANSLMGVAAAAYRQNKLDDAEPLLREAVAIYQQRPADLPASLDWRRNEGVALHNIASIQKARGDLDAAEKTFTGYIAIVRGRLAEEPHDRSLQWDLAIGLRNTAQVHDTRGDWQGGMEFNAEALDILRALHEFDAANTLWGSELLEAEIGYANEAFESGRMKEAMEGFTRWQKLLDELGRGEQWRQDRPWLLMRYLGRLAYSSAANGEYIRAEEALARAETILVTPGDDARSIRLVTTVGRAEIARHQGDTTRARELFENAAREGTFLDQLEEPGLQALQAWARALLETGVRDEALRVARKLGEDVGREFKDAMIRHGMGAEELE